MNQNGLLKLYGRLADSENAVARLRTLIVDLGAQGRLVDQDRCDEPAIRLLERIEAERRRLGTMEEHSTISESSLVPNGWAATTIGQYAIGVFTGPFGSVIHKSDYVNDGVPLITQQSRI